jgi:hypothetical protein
MTFKKTTSKWDASTVVYKAEGPNQTTLQVWWDETDPHAPGWMAQLKLEQEQILICSSTSFMNMGAMPKKATSVKTALKRAEEMVRNFYRR